MVVIIWEMEAMTAWADGPAEGFMIVITSSDSILKPIFKGSWIIIIIFQKNIQHKNLGNLAGGGFFDCFMFFQFPNQIEYFNHG